MSSKKTTKLTKNRGKNQSENILIETLTPVHVGSGEELKNNFDFILKGANPFVVDINQTLSVIQPDNPGLKEYLNSASLEDLVSIAGEEYGYPLQLFDSDLTFKEKNHPIHSRSSTISQSKVRMPVKKTAFNQKIRKTLNGSLETIREQIKDAFFRPYIPASSLKGALRTALWAEVLLNSSPQLIDFFLKESQSNFNNSTSNRKDIKKFREDLIFGKEPKQDIMRVLHISDGYFDIDNIRLGDIRVFNNMAPKAYKWRNMAYNSKNGGNALKNTDKWQEAKGIYIEMLNAGAKAEFSFSWDEFLLSNLSWRNSLNLKDHKHKSKAFKRTELDDAKNDFKDITQNLFPKSFMDWKKILNKHALRIVQNEVNFFKSYPPLLEFYKNLESKIQTEDSSNKEGFAYLRLGWASGWTGMTGLSNSLFDKIPKLKKIVEQKNKKMKTQNLYPKTRRLLVQKRQPCLPLGWVRLSLSDGSFKNPYKTGRAFFVKNPSSGEKHNFSPWLAEQIHKLRRKHNIPDSNGVLKGTPLAEEWKNISNKEEKQKILEEIKSYWKNKDWWKDPPGRSFKKTKAIYKGN